MSGLPWMPSRKRRRTIGAGVPANNVGTYGDQYIDSTTGLLWQKTRGGYLSGSDTASISSVTSEYVDPNTKSFGLVGTIKFDTLPTTTTSIYANRTSGVGTVLFFDATTNKVTLRVSKNGSTAHNCVTPVVVAGETYSFASGWDHISNVLDLNWEGTAISANSASGSVTVATNNMIVGNTSASGGVYAVSYMARKRRYVTVEEQARILLTRYFNAVGCELVFNPSAHPTASGSSVTNFGQLELAFTNSDGSPATFWSEWWIPVAKQINGSFGSMTLPQIMALPGGYLTDDVADDAVTLVDPLLASGQDFTIITAVRYDTTPFNITNHFLISTAGSYLKFLIRNTTPGNNLDIYLQRDAGYRNKNVGVIGGHEGETIIICATINATEARIRTSLGNEIHNTSLSGGIVSGVNISNGSGDTKRPFLAMYLREFSNAEMDAIVNGGNLPAEVPAYVYCPALQGKVGSNTILTSAGAATLTDASPTDFWTHQ